LSEKLIKSAMFGREKQWILEEMYKTFIKMTLQGNHYFGDAFLNFQKELMEIKMEPGEKSNV